MAYKALHDYPLPLTSLTYFLPPFPLIFFTVATLASLLFNMFTIADLSQVYTLQVLS
jgi:hypothetical protein